MSVSLNRATLIGNLGRDPEVRQTSSGQRVCNFPLAMTERWSDKQTGEKRERTEWMRIVIFDDRLVDVAEKYLRKGSRAFVEGQLQTRKWQDQSGQDRFTTEIVLQKFGGTLVMLDGKPSGSAEDSAPSGGASGPPSGGDLDDEVPFAPLREMP